MIPVFPTFKILEQEDLPVINNHFEKYQPEICELTPTTLTIWQNFDLPHLTLINRNLCILIKTVTQEEYFLEPIGNHQIPETVALCLSHSHKLSRLSKKLIDKISPSTYTLKTLRSHFDYVYRTVSLAELKGRDFAGKRNHIKNFKKHYPHYKFTPLLASDMEQAVALFEKWITPKGEAPDLSQLAYTAQKKALIQAFANFSLLKLLGAQITVDGKMAGFLIASRLNAKTATIHFQYTDRTYRGIAQILLQEVCQQTLSEYTYVNLEQDLGLAGLRKAKLSYYPERIEEKYELTAA